MYVAVKGGERAIGNAHALLAVKRRGDRATPESRAAQIDEQLSLAVDRVMSEGSLYDRRIAALAIKQARGDLIEAIFLVRAYRTTLPRIGFAEPLDTAAMAIRRRVSATFKDLPGGQVLGPTFDYTHRLIDFELECANGPCRAERARRIACRLAAGHRHHRARRPDRARNRAAPDAVGRRHHPRRAEFPFAAGDARLQTLARGDEGFLLGLAYSTQRGYGRTHPFVGEIRFGEVEVELFVDDLGFAVPLGGDRRHRMPDGQPVRRPRRWRAALHPRLRPGVRPERAQGDVDGAGRPRAARRRIRRGAQGPAQDEEFVLSHCDNVQATGFVEHLKLPHYVDFQAELALLRRLRRERKEKAEAEP